MSAVGQAPRPGEHVVTVTIDESSWRVRAVARMPWREGELAGIGHTRCGELLPDRTAESVAVSRALTDLARRVQASGGT